MVKHEKKHETETLSGKVYKRLLFPIDDKLDSVSLPACLWCDDCKNRSSNRRDYKWTLVCLLLNHREHLNVLGYDEDWLVREVLLDSELPKHELVRYDVPPEAVCEMWSKPKLRCWDAFGLGSCKYKHLKAKLEELKQLNKDYSHLSKQSV